MHVEIVTIGDELTAGKILNSNATSISQLLFENGYEVVRVQVVPDERNLIQMALGDALAYSDAVIVTGGLGPTQDDITTEAVADLLKLGLHEDAKARAFIEKVFKDRKSEMPSSNLKQALVPEGATLIYQKIGTAPGYFLGIGNKALYVLPGVPSEMFQMLQEAVIPDMNMRFKRKAISSQFSYSLWGITESRLANLLSDFHKRLPETIRLSFQASLDEGIKVRITCLDEDLGNCARLNAQLRELVGDYCYSLSGLSPEEEVAKRLIKANKTLAVAESLTGGLISSKLISVDGASKCFSGAIVTYSLEGKKSHLDGTITDSISEDTVIKMAKAVKEKFGATIGIATTGVAGKDWLEGHEPGYALIGINCDNDCVKEIRTRGSRNIVRSIVANSALIELLRKCLNS